MILLSGFSLKGAIFVGTIVILIIGVFTGNKGGRGHDSKPNVSSSKHINDMAHSAKTGDPNYCPHGSGKYHGYDGKIHYDKK